MTDPWMDGARPDEARDAPRGRLVILLVIALALPVVIVVLGSRGGPPTLLEYADAAPTQVVTQVSAEPATATTEDPTTTAADTTTSVDSSTTAWSSASTTPTTSWSSSTAAKTTTSPTTTAKAPTTTAMPVAKAAPPTTSAPVTAPPTTAKPAPTPSQSAAAFLACVRQRESGGNYRINTGNGYYGAYQFHPTTWNNAALIAGRPDLVGVRPDLASPADQDAVALALYLAVGPSPWGGVCY